MSVSITSTRTTCKISLSRINPELGPDLKCRIYLNNKQLDTFAISTPRDLQYTINVDDGDNYLDVEHYDRHNANTETDANNNVLRTSMILIKDIKIHDVKFYATSIHSYNKFLPAYDDAYLEWARMNQPGKNFPDEMKASPEIGLNGKFRLHFKWPLYLHALYHTKLY